MNRILLKQQSKKKKQEQEIEEEQEEKPKQELRITQEVIENKLLRHFQYHIGEENKTTSEEIFQVVIGFNSNLISSYARFYWWDIIQKIMRKLRRKDKCFIIHKKGIYFVLQTLNECQYYQGQCDDAIDKMEKAKIRAEDWVEKEKWKNMEIPDEDESKPTSKKPKKPRKKPKEIDDYKNKLKTKVIKLWKGEK